MATTWRRCPPREIRLGRSADSCTVGCGGPEERESEVPHHKSAEYLQGWEFFESRVVLRNVLKSIQKIRKPTFSMRRSREREELAKRVCALPAGDWSGSRACTRQIRQNFICKAVWMRRHMKRPITCFRYTQDTSPRKPFKSAPLPLTVNLPKRWLPREGLPLSNFQPNRMQPSC